MPEHAQTQVQTLKRLLKAVLDRAEAPQPGIHSAVPAFDGAELPDVGMAVQVKATDSENAEFGLYSQDDEISSAEEPLFEREHAAESAVVAKDELDADLLPVFLEV